MSGRALAEAASRPALAPHVRLRFDQAREAWTLQAPERVFMLDDIAHAIVSRCDGQASVAAIVDQLAGAYDAPRGAIEADVLALVQDFVDKSVLTL